MSTHTDLREKLANHTTTLDDFESVITELKYRIDVRRKKKKKNF